MKFKIPASKGSFVPACYFPTLTLLIDDNGRFLQGLQRFLGKEYSTLPFDNSVKIFNFISQYKNTDKIPLYTNLSLKEGDINISDELININIPEIVKILQREDRFEELSVVVVDYAMPGMNGIEVSSKIKEEIATPIKIIMLTGEADEHTAVNAFNNGVINRFIKKSADDCLVKVKEYLADLEIRYFQDLSRTVAESFKARANFILEEPDFINIFNKIIEENKIIEYYLIEDSGSFMMLDKDGKITRLIVKTAEDMETLYDIARDDKKVSKSVLKKLENRERLVYFPDKESELTPAKDWQLHQATQINGQKDYYYALIEGVKDYPLEIPNIYSYSEYLKNKKK